MYNNNLTLGIIKPGAIHNHHVGEIIAMIEAAGFILQEVRMVQFTEESAQEFYAVHSERPFYADLCKGMAVGPVVVMVLEKENAVKEFRKLIGATNPVDAAEGTIRRRFGTSVEANAIHGSDADATATREIQFFFGGCCGGEGGGCGCS